MNSGSVASMLSGSQTDVSAAMRFSHHRSRPTVMSVRLSMRRTTMHFLTWRHEESAWSQIFLRSRILPARYPKFDVTTTVAPESTMRSLSASAESPLNTTQWMAPMRAHASMPMAS